MTFWVILKQCAVGSEDTTHPAFLFFNETFVTISKHCALCIIFSCFFFLCRLTIKTLTSSQHLWILSWWHDVKGCSMKLRRRQGLHWWPKIEAWHFQDHHRQYHKKTSRNVPIGIPALNGSDEAAIITD